jgi:hypothetical protein
VSCCMRQMVVKPNLTGFMIHASTFFGRYLWPTDAYLYSQSCEIYRLGPNKCI